jgi:protein-glutamine gamma-glutamyltransferase
MAAFAGLSALAAWRYAGIEARPPAIRVLALVSLAIAAGAALTLTAVGSEVPATVRRRASAARAGLIGLALIAALVAAGLPPRLLLPLHWGTLAHDLHRGLRTISTTLWPYAGHNRWARIDILIGLAILAVAAAALGCLPSPVAGRASAVRRGIRRLSALALLMTLYVVGVLDSNGGSATAEGLALLALLVAWLWLPGLRARRTVAGLAWLAVAGGVAAGVAGALGGGQAWFDYRSWNLLGSGGTRTAFSWDQTYGPIPWSRSPGTMFTVRTARAGFWKVTTLDRFDGLRFVRSGTAPSLAADLPLPLNDRWYEFATFTLAGLSTRLLPTQQGTTAGVNFGRPHAYEPDGTVRTTTRPLAKGDSYTVMSYAPEPSPAELRAAPHSFPVQYLRYTEFDLPGPTQSGLRMAGDPVRPGEFFTSRTVGAPASGRSPAPAARSRRLILASPYGPMYRLARRVASGLHSTYDVVLAAQNYLKARYAYSEQSPRRRYPLEAFLFVDHIGYCQQFSATMALMLRMDGIPARVAAGFLPGSYDGATGSYRVSALDAHAWVEVYFTGIGWVPFDPTPPRTLTAPQAQLFASQTRTNRKQVIAATVDGARPVGRAAIPKVQHPRTARISGAARGAMIGAAGLALVTLLAAFARWLRGYRRLRRSLEGDGELATRELIRALRPLGYVVPGPVTLSQIERLARLHGGEEAARYVGLLRERRYGRGGRRVSMGDRRRLRRGLTAHQGPVVRLRGHWVLPPATMAWRLPADGQPGGPGMP